VVLDSRSSQQLSGETSGGDEPGKWVPASVGVAPGNRLGPLRWWIWSLLAAAYLFVMFHRYAPGVVADRLMADFAVGGAAIGILTAIYPFVYAVMQVPAGALADGFGARKTVAMGTALAGIGSLVFGIAPVLEMAYLGRLFVGLGVSVIFVAALKCQASWFRASEFGTMSGFLILVGSLGSVSATTPMALVAQSLGWRASFTIVGAASCIVAVAVWRWVRDHPSELGLPSLPGAAVAPSTNRSASKKPPLLSSVWSVLGNPQTRAGFLAHFGILGSYQAFAGLWAVPYLMHVYGMERSEAANHLLVATLGMIVSAPLAGLVSDRLLERRKMPIMALAMLACCCWLTLNLWNGGQPPAWALYPLFATFGFSCGAVTLVLAAVKEANPPELSGLAMGTANGAFLGATLLQPALGYLLDRQWQGAMLDGARVYPFAAYQGVLPVLAGFAFLGLLGSSLIKETYCRNAAEGYASRADVDAVGDASMVTRSRPS